MGLKIEKSKNKEKNLKTGVDRVFEERAIRSDNIQFKKAKGKLFVWAILCVIALLLIGYSFLPTSRVQFVSILGNSYLDKTYLETLSDVDFDSYFYLVRPKKIEKKLLQDPFIDEAHVSMLPGNLVKIDIKEKQPIGYRYDGDKPEILFVDGSKTELTSDYMPVIARVPLIKGFNDAEQTHLLCVAFTNVNPSMIENMSEIQQYPLSFDQQALMVQMRDGMHFFSNYFSLEVINEYNGIIEHVKDHSKCLFADSTKKVAFCKACPWDEVPVEREYWMRDDGSYITNKWGDKAVKHYYADKNGNFYLDKAGNKIVIPISVRGNDDPDKDFEEHYYEGYYDTGVLIMPQDEDSEETDEKEEVDSSTESKEEETKKKE